MAGYEVAHKYNEKLSGTFDVDWDRRLSNSEHKMFSHTSESKGETTKILIDIFFEINKEAQGQERHQLVTGVSFELFKN